jgi:hypothetical protein
MRAVDWLHFARVNATRGALFGAGFGALFGLGVTAWFELGRNSGGN